MSDRVVAGIRLLRAVFEAQRAHDLARHRDDGISDEWRETRDALRDAKIALREFETSTDEDWKLKQSGDR